MPMAQTRNPFANNWTTFVHLCTKPPTRKTTNATEHANIMRNLTYFWIWASSRDSLSDCPVVNFAVCPITVFSPMRITSKKNNYKNKKILENGIFQIVV